MLSPYSSAKITLPWKNKKTKHPHSNTPSPKSQAMTDAGRTSPKPHSLGRRQERSQCRRCVWGNCKDMELKVRAGYKVI